MKFTLISVSALIAIAAAAPQSTPASPLVAKDTETGFKCYDIYCPMDGKGDKACKDSGCPHGCGDEFVGKCNSKKSKREEMMERQAPTFKCYDIYCPMDGTGDAMCASQGCKSGCGNVYVGKCDPCPEHDGE